MSKGGGKQQVVNNAPWTGQQPYLLRLFNRADQLYRKTPTPDTGLLDAAAGQTEANIRGDFLDPTSNPFFSGALNNTLDAVRTKINSQFGGDNYGNSAHQEWLNKGMTEAASGLLADQYNRERGIQQASIANAPGLTQSQVQAPFLPLQQYASLVGGGGYGGQQTQNPHTNPLSGAIGGALGGHVLGKELLGLTGPWGALAGAGLGLLGSL